MSEAARAGDRQIDASATRAKAVSILGHGVSFGDALRVWLRVAALSFGGPAGQIAVMHRILVDEKRWIGESRFLHALSYCTLLPGPEAQQLAIYIGWLMHRTKGGIVAGGLFVLPGLLSIMALSYVYAGWGRVGAVAALFFGLKSAVLAVVLQAVVRIGSKALKNRVLVGIAAAAFMAIFFLGVPFPLVVLAAGLVGWLGTRAGSSLFQVGGGHGGTGAKGLAEADSLLGETLPEHARVTVARARLAALVWGVLWLAPVAALLLTLGTGNTFSRIALFFSEMAVVTFGGAYAVLAYVAQQAVEHYGWLRPGEMLDGLGMAETTPGPLIMVTQFVGFMAAYRDPGPLNPMVAATLGGLLTTWVTFTPCFLWVFLGAPFIERLRGNKALSGALSAVMAAVVGVILNLALWFALHTWFREAHPLRRMGLGFDLPVPASLDPWALALSVAAMLSMFRLKAGMIPTLLACAVAGVVLQSGGGNVVNRRSIVLGVRAMPRLAGMARAQDALGGPDLFGCAVGPLPPDFLTSWRTGQGPPGDWRMVEDGLGEPGQGDRAGQHRSDRLPLPAIGVGANSGPGGRGQHPLQGRRGLRRPRRWHRRPAARARRLLRDPGQRARGQRQSLYRVMGGKRQQIAGARAKVSSGEWHTLALRRRRPVPVP